MKLTRRTIIVYFFELLILAGIIVAILSLPFDRASSPIDQGIHITDPDFSGTPLPLGGHTGIFTKYVTPGTPYLLVDLNSGDPNDSLSLSIITPDAVLGPYTDISQGKHSGRIYLRIDGDNNLTPGRWDFIVHSNKTIEIGSVGQYPWTNSSLFDQKPDN
ncbi:hypothetical protein [Methanoregula sp.]|jgi:hypothetical protein|uniref:hypothetical protein n=1 Tax=Methanoregula sp. TaxID=2052170 RepID=UPI003C264D71